jgi:hypothetical protein
MKRQQSAGPGGAVRTSRLSVREGVNRSASAPAAQRRGDKVRRVVPPAGDLVLYADSDAISRIITTNVQALKDQEFPISYSNRPFDIKGKVTVSTKNARVTVNNALFLSDVKISVRFDEFFVLIDWHWWIPNRFCVVFFDACSQRLESCLEFNLGEAKLSVPLLPVEHYASLEIQNVRMVLDSDGKYYEMFGNLGTLSTLFANLPEQLVESLKNEINRIIRDLLTIKIGGGEVAKAIIDFMLSTWDLVGKVTGSSSIVNKTWNELFREILDGFETFIENTIHANIAEFNLNFKIPVDYPFIPEQAETHEGVTYVHKEVTLRLPTPPAIQFRNGLWLIVGV